MTTPEVHWSDLVRSPAELRAALTGGLSPNAPGVLGTALSSASTAPLESLRILVAAGVDLDAQDHVGNTALHRLVRANRCDTWEAMACLLDGGARTDIANAERDTAFALACGRSKFDELPDLPNRFAHRVDVAFKPPRGRTALGWALFYALSDTARTLVGRGASAKVLAKPDQLMCAVCMGDLAGVRALLAKGVSPDKWRGWKEEHYGGFSVMQVAAGEGSLEIVDALLAAGANPDQGYFAHRPITQAARRGFGAVVTRLLSAGSKCGVGALATAVQHDQTALVDQLIAAGVARRWAIHTAMAHGKLSALEKLVHAAGAPECPGEPGDETALPYDSVVREGRAEMLAFLLRYPIPLGRLDRQGRTLLGLARECGNEEIAAMLERAGAPGAQDRAPEVMARWRAALAKHRRDWPEWRALEAAAASDDWTWRVKGGSDYLVRRDRSLSVRVLPETTTVVPAFAAPLVCLRPGDDLDQAGSVGGWATLGRVTRSNAGDLCPGGEEEGVRFPPGGLVALQTNQSGCLVAVDVSGNAVGFTGREFARIGRVEAFLRYCLRETLAGRRWDERFSRGADLTEHGITAVALLD